MLDTEIRAGAVRCLQQAMGIGAYTVGALTGSSYARFLGLRAAAERALSAGDFEEASVLAGELLRLAERYRKDWNYGNAYHHGHLLLGHISLERGLVSEARNQLLEAARTPGSPQLNSFGPNMSLATRLLEERQREAVIEYLELCKAFWTAESVSTPKGAMSAADVLERWKNEIKEGRTPDFGPNQVY